MSPCVCGGCWHTEQYMFNEYNNSWGKTPPLWSISLFGGEILATSSLTHCVPDFVTVWKKGNQRAVFPPKSWCASFNLAVMEGFRANKSLHPFFISPLFSLSIEFLRERWWCALSKGAVSMCLSECEWVRDLPGPWCVQVRGAWMIGGRQGLVVTGTRGGGGEDGCGRGSGGAGARSV